jgi:hypothetical protein
VVPDADLFEALPTHELLGAGDLGELLRRNLLAVRESAREAGERGLVPRRKIEVFRHQAYLFLGHARFRE